MSQFSGYAYVCTCSNPRNTVTADVQAKLFGMLLCLLLLPVTTGCFVDELRVCVDIIGHARIIYVGKYLSCMV